MYQTEYINLQPTFQLFNLKTMHMLLKKKDQYILFSTPQIVKYMNMYLVQVCTYINTTF